METKEEKQYEITTEVTLSQLEKWDEEWLHGPGIEVHRFPMGISPLFGDDKNY